MREVRGSGSGLSSRAPGWAIVGALAFAGLTSSFMYTLMVPLQAELPTLLNATREDTSWVVTITLLVAAVATPISGRLGDMFGKRRVVLVLVVLLVLGSAVAALSTSITGVILGRGMQGLSTGVIPLGIAIMRDVLRPERLSTAIALMSATMGVGGALGMPLSAYVARVSDWHMLFWMAAALGVLCFALIFVCVPESDLRVGGRIDWLGVLGLAVGLTGLLLYISRGSEWGWASPAALGSLAAGTVALLVWAWYQLRRSDPLVNLRVAARPSVLFANLAGIGMGFAFFASNVTFPQLLELPRDSGVGFGLTMFEAALCIMPSGLLMMLLAPLSGKLERVFGPRLLLGTGTSLIMVAYVSMLIFSSEIWHVVLASAFIGVGIAFSFAAMPMIIMRAVPAHETGVSNGLNALFRSVGTASAAAVMGAVLAAMSTAENLPTREAFMVCFWIALAAAAIATVCAFLVPKSSKWAGESALDDPRADD
jgi:predicted MFS family arabinose efflux permease